MQRDQAVAIAVAVCAALWLLRAALVAWWPRSWRRRTPLDEFLTLSDLSALGVAIRPRDEAPRWKSAVLVGGALVLACGWSYALGTQVVLLVREDIGLVSAVPSAIEAAIWSGAAVAISLHRIRTPPYGFALVSLVQLVGDAGALVQDALVCQGGEQLRLNQIARLVGIGTLLLMLGVVLTLPLLDSFVGDISAPLGAPSSSAETAPDDNATLFSWLLFTWITPMINVGRSRTLCVHVVDVLS